MSHITAVHFPNPFTAVLLPPSDPRRLDGNACELVQQEPIQEPGADTATIIHLLTPLNYYQARHASLSGWSPVEMVMVFKAGKAQTLNAKQFLLQDTHPLHLTHGHTPLLVLCLPQLVSEAPSRPTSTAIPAECEAYAAYAIGNFFSDRHLPGLQGATLWEKMQDWEARKPRGWQDRLAWRMLDNIQLRVRTRQLMAEDAREVRAQLAACRAAGRKARTPAEEARSADWGEDDEEYELAGCDEDMMQRIDRMATTDAMELLLNNDSYFAGALHLLATNAPVHITTPLLPSELHSPVHLDDFNNSMASAQQNMQQDWVSRSTATTPTETQTTNLSKQLYVQTVNPGGVVASVIYIGLHPASATISAEIALDNTAIQQGGPPPYIKMGRLPTDDETISLFHLCDEQAFPFRIMVSTLLKVGTQIDFLLLTDFCMLHFICVLVISYSLTT
jgi:hypothetical protein